MKYFDLRKIFLFGKKTPNPINKDISVPLFSPTQELIEP